MPIPDFAATDHYEFKKWARDLRKKLKAVSQQLYETLGAADTAPGRLREALTQAEAQYAVLREAWEKLPPNLAESLRQGTKPAVEDLDDEIASARHRLEVTDA